MSVTILICTRDNTASLERTLSSIAAQTVAADISWRVVVVNNASSDDTSRRLQAFAKTVDLQVIDEARPGLSIARNTGVAQARSDYIIFTDDDVTVPADWVGAYAAAFRRYPDAAFFGGDIDPVFPGADAARARALTAAAGSCFARFQAGPHDTRIDAASNPKLYPFGANMAFRADALKQFRFAESLGRRPDGLVLSGEETGLIADMVASGHVGYLVADNPVQHWIAPSRQTRDYVRQYYYGQGWQQASVAATSATWTSQLDRTLSPVIVHLFTLARLVVRWVPIETVNIWIERQHGHFTGRAAALLKSDRA